MMLMVGTVLGPGTIFLMLTGALSIAFSVANFTSLLINLIPVLGFMIVCYFFPSNIQIFVAQVLSAAYALLMMAVLVGLLLQVNIFPYR